jgi:hypothetical protein
MTNIELLEPEHWTTRLRDAHLKVVVDPMVFRTADVFFHGATGYDREDGPTWEVIKSNIGALVAFVDAVVMYDQLPVFNYARTFPELRLIEATRQYGEFLVPVFVSSASRQRLSAQAKEALQRRPPIGDALVREIYAELDVLEFHWDARLEPDGVITPRDPEAARRLERVRTYTYGGLLFDAYAAELGGEHVLQPKRSRLFTSVSNAKRIQVGRLFEELRSEADAAPPGFQRFFAMPEVPTFLPYLLEFLDADATPKHLLDAAFSLRADPEVAAYRTFIRRVQSDLDNGRPVDVAQEASELAKAFRASVGLPGDATMSLAVQQFVSERPYRRLLMDLAAAQHRYVEIDKALQRIWTRPARAVTS